MAAIGDALDSCDGARRAGRVVGVRPVRLHDARHTAGTLLNANSTDPRTIQAMLGHADVDNPEYLRQTHQRPRDRRRRGHGSTDASDHLTPHR